MFLSALHNHSFVHSITVIAFLAGTFSISGSALGIANQRSKCPQINHNALTTRVDKGLFALEKLRTAKDGKKPGLS